MSGKLRYCECGRELEYHCHVCSECRQINIDHAIDVRNASQAHKERSRKWMKEHYQRRGLKYLRELREGK